MWGKGVRTKKVVICSPPLSPRSKLFSISRILIIFCPFYFGEIERCAIGEKEGKEDDERTFSEWIAIEDRSKYMENKKIKKESDCFFRFPNLERGNEMSLK